MFEICCLSSDFISGTTSEWCADDQWVMCRRPVGAVRVRPRFQVQGAFISSGIRNAWKTKNTQGNRGRTCTRVPVHRVLQRHHSKENLCPCTRHLETCFIILETHCFLEDMPPPLKVCSVSHMLLFVLFCSFNKVKKDFSLEVCPTVASHDNGMKKERQLIHVFIQRETTAGTRIQICFPPKSYQVNK